MYISWIILCVLAVIFCPVLLFVAVVGSAYILAIFLAVTIVTAPMWIYLLFMDGNIRSDGMGVAACISLALFFAACYIFEKREDRDFDKREKEKNKILETRRKLGYDDSSAPPYL